MFLVSYMTSPMPLSYTSGNYDCHIATLLYLYYYLLYGLYYLYYGLRYVLIVVVVSTTIA
jgi:hypothetical protein